MASRVGVNSFSALQGHSSDGSDSEEQDTGVAFDTVGTSNREDGHRSISSFTLKETDQSDNDSLDQMVSVTESRQAGGTLTIRLDPVTGLKDDKTIDLGFTADDLEACVRVVDILGRNPKLFKLARVKPLRAALHPLIMEQIKSNYAGSGVAENRSMSGKGKKRKWRRRNHDEDDSDRAKRIAELEAEYVNQTQLRALRMQQLDCLNEEGKELVVPRIPDGPAVDTIQAAEANGFSPRLLLTSSSGKEMIDNVSDHEKIDITNGNPARAEVARRLALLQSIPIPSTSADMEDQEVLLRDPISCYICRKPYRKLHFFYHQLCPDCAQFNYAKRNEMADMRGKICLVTGARCKIGFRCALKLLRCGAKVIVTTRFPHDAARRYLEEQDSAVWWDNLNIYGLDFRNLSSVEAFCTYVNIVYDRLDVIVNNAAQTVRRPPAYYSHLIEGEKMIENYSFSSSTVGSDAGSRFGGCREEDVFEGEATGEEAPPADVGEAEERKNKQKECDALKAALKHQYRFTELLTRGNAASACPAIQESTVEGSTGLRGGDSSASAEPQIPSLATSAMGLTLPTETGNSLVASSAAMTQMELTAGDEEVACAGSALFPLGATDVNRQQVDLRKHNSWTMRLHEIPTIEMAEVFAINSIAPTIINARLKPLMERDKDTMKFIVNVSAMEGKFYRYKSDTHPHTNMAKAALNMMTRTSAQDYVKSKIYMTAVDTGWINDEKPVERALNHHKQHNFQTPIDEIDAAARVLDPIISPLLAAQRGEPIEPPWGHFLKDYQRCEW